MTLPSFINKGPQDSTMINRDHYGHVPWKSGSGSFKGAQSALSALTLLAFLFFLNVLQSCLKDQLQAHAPITIWMTTQTTTSTANKKVKRDTEDYAHKFAKGDPAIIPTQAYKEKTNDDEIEIIIDEDRIPNTDTSNNKLQIEKLKKKGK